MPRTKSFMGIMWSSSQRFGTMIISFISNLILVRILTPSDFGTVGMLLFFISISNVFIDSGFGAALIQKKNTTDKDYSSIFILNIIVSVILYIILSICAPLISRFYNTPTLTSLLRVEGLVLIGNALCMVQTNILKKKMDFKRLAYANLIGNFVGAILSIIAAIGGLGVWSLVVRVLCVAYISALLLWKVGDWRPSYYFNFKIVKDLFNFGGFMLLSTILNTVASNLQTLIIGKLFHQRILGIYTQSMNLRNVVADSLQSVIAQVLFPDYSSLKSDKDIELKLNKAFYIISYYTVFLLVFLYIVAFPLIDFLYSTKWIAAAPYFKILCIGGVFYAIQDINYYVIAAKGRSRLLSNINLVKMPIYIITLIMAGLYKGIEGVLWCIVLYAIISYILYGYYACKLINTSIRNQAISLIKCCLISVSSGGALFFILNCMAIESKLLFLLIAFIVYSTIFFSISMIFKVQPFYYVINMLKR